MLASKHMAKTVRFGVATADHQCEAYTGQDDIRDVWERVRGLTARGRATDFWNRYREDVDLAKGMGCTAFRLSLSWARLEPQPGAWDDAAFAHYRDVLQYMRAAGMATVVTLHHNTWPLHVQAAGNGAGMLDDGFPDRMASYAGEAAKRLGDLIDYYVTINEPNQLVYGYIKGFWMRAYPMPPGLPPFATSEQQMDAVLRLIPNLFRAHARSRQAILQRHSEALVGTNPLVLGLPRWLQRLVDRNATHLRSPEHARKQASRLSQPSILESGSVDISIAQLTLTKQREDHVLFSEPYLTAHLAVMHPAAVALPQDLRTWRGRVAVVRSGVPASLAGAYFTAADVQYFEDLPAAAEALHQKAVDLVFDDDVMLAPFTSAGYSVSRVRGHDQHFAVAMAFGSRSLLNAVDRALRAYKERNPHLPDANNRKTIAHVGKSTAGDVACEPESVPDLDRSLQRIRKRGVLRVGVHEGVPGLCMKGQDGRYEGLEPDIARHIAASILGSEEKVTFVPLRGDKRMHATHSSLQWLLAARKSFAMFGTLLGTNWWNLGLAGKLPAFLCPPECVGTIEYVGVDYYWGVPSFWPGELHRLAAAADCRYANAPVWPGVLKQILREEQARFPGKPIIVIENGCVDNADGFSRARYLEAHLRELQEALDAGVPIDAYLCWSITSNREWGLPFDGSSDFGLYHIDLDTDPNLTRTPTDASSLYARVIASGR